MGRIERQKRQLIEESNKRLLCEEEELDIKSIYKDVEKLKEPGSDISISGRHGDELTPDEKIEKLSDNMDTLLSPDDDHKGHGDEVSVESEVIDLKSSIITLEEKLRDNEGKYNDLLVDMENVLEFFNEQKPNNTFEYEERISSLEEKINNLTDITP